ncbi:MAG TPA: tetratricopeptide repeat protein [Methanoregula sp.]|nr:tetratricopeptide repeat protein [Methanoregula sp.]
MARDTPGRHSSGTGAAAPKPSPGTIESLDRMLEENPRDWRTLNAKAVALINLGRFEESLGCSRQAAAIVPGQADSWVSMGVAYDNLGRYSEAAEVLERAVRLSPYDTYARALLAIAYQRLEMPDQADEQNRKLQEMVFPREYAGFYFTLAAFMLGLLLGGIRSVEGSSPVVSAAAQLIILVFFLAIARLFWRSLKTEREVARQGGTTATTGPRRERNSRPAGMVIALCILGAAFIIGIVAGIWLRVH